MPVQAQRPARKAATASSFAALNTAGRHPPALPAARARSRAGKAWASTGSKVQLVGSANVSGRLAPARRSGQAERERDRHVHVGRADLGDRRAVDEGDHRVDHRLRVDDDVDALVGHAEEQVGLDQLEPLVDQRRRVQRHHRPHRPRGVGERLVDGDAGELGARDVRGTGRRRPSARGARPPRRGLPRRHCASAECSESTGTSWPGVAVRVTSGPPATSDSLLASASVEPAASAARVGARPREPSMALSTTSAPEPASSAAASGPARTSAPVRSRRSGAAAGSATATRRHPELGGLLRRAGRDGRPRPPAR